MMRRILNSVNWKGLQERNIQSATVQKMRIDGLKEELLYLINISGHLSELVQ